MVSPQFYRTNRYYQEFPRQAGPVSGERIVDVSHNYDGWIYAVTNETGNNLYKRAVGPGGTTGPWEQVPNITNVRKIDAIPYTDEFFYARETASNSSSATIDIMRAPNDGSNQVTWVTGRGVDKANGDFLNNWFSIAATFGTDGTVHLVEQTNRWDVRYHTAPGVSALESSVYNFTFLTGSGKKNQMIHGVLHADQATLPHRIFSKTPAGEYVDDERVQTSHVSNTVTIPVTPGTYTITQGNISGWHISGIKLQESGTANSTYNIADGTVTVTVEEGEHVFVEVENQFTQITELSGTCESTFTENFNSYVSGRYGKPVSGLTSYHKAPAQNNSNFGFGYYAVMTNTKPGLNYGLEITDHTGDGGGMLVVDATFERGTFYRRRFTGLVDGASYSFSAWFNNFNPDAKVKPNISFEIYRVSDGELIASANTNDIIESGWKNASMVFVSDGGAIELVLRNNALGTSGNDLAIDDITFSYSPPAPGFELTYCDPTVSGVKLEVTAPLSIGSGSGYEYRIGAEGTWQASPVFSGLSEGTHTLYVRYAGQDGCLSSTVVEIGAQDCIALSGTVWHDPDGNTEFDGGEKPISGDNSDPDGGASSITGGSIYANLVGDDDKVIVSKRVNVDGTYAFSNVEKGNTYKVILTLTEQTPGTSLTDGEIPEKWESTGTNTTYDPVNGKKPANRGNVIDLGTVNTTLAGINFGMQQPPVADPKAYIVENEDFSTTPPSGISPQEGYQSIPASSGALTGYPTGGSLSGSDPEDCAGPGDCNTDTGTTFSIVTIQDNTRLFYDFGTGFEEIDVTGGPVTIENFDVNKLVFFGENGSESPLLFTYTITDKAGSTSPPVNYTISPPGPLPVTLIGFEVHKEGNGANLTWSTVSELSNQGFEVERSHNGANWAKIGFVASQSPGHNSTGRLNYHYTDAAPLKGINYYRLKQLDLDGKSEHSGIRSIRIDKAAPGMTVYPNPTGSGSLTIDIAGTGSYRAEVYSLAGVRVLQHNLLNGRELDVRPLTAGMYVLRLVSENGEVQTSTFVVK